MAGHTARHTGPPWHEGVKNARRLPIRGSRHLKQRTVEASVKEELTAPWPAKTNGYRQRSGQNGKGEKRFASPLRLSGAGNETCTRRVSRCFPNSFFAEVLSEDLNCSLVFGPRQQDRPKTSTDGHRPVLSAPDPHPALRRPRQSRTGRLRLALCFRTPSTRWRPSRCSWRRPIADAV